MEFRFGPTVIRVTHADAAALLRAVDDRLAARQGAAVATINLDHLVKLRRDPAFRMAYAAQDIVVADGNPVVWLSRLARRSVSLVPGSDMTLPLVRLAAARGLRVALVGSNDTALAAAADRLRAEVPGVDVALTIAPPFPFDPLTEGDPVLARIAVADIALCLLALGAPRQEVLAARGRAAAPRTVFASIGAGVDFLAGRQTRAPAWVRRIAMEWLWRAASQPRRLIPRYAACAAILPAQAWAAWKIRR
jgi:exopolysaccharide biosynthesis WecB/TagA/CpsF family protein